MQRALEAERELGNNPTERRQLADAANNGRLWLKRFRLHGQ